jgi:hypothetical protein
MSRNARNVHRIKIMIAEFLRRLGVAAEFLVAPFHTPRSVLLRPVRVEATRNRRNRIGAEHRR